MATVCAGSLALMDAGVPIRKAVAGIAMGLVLEGDRFRILTDILGDEDHLGDMDFKVAGTRDGITAFQMDIKVQGISAELMARALKQAGEARFRILDIMDRTIPVPRGDISPYAPRFLTVMIPIDRIGALIGPGGKNIREIIAQTNTTIDVDDTGTVRIGSTNSENAAEARRRVEDLTAVPVEGKIYNGTVKKITDFGAFVEIIPGTEGLLHISEIERFRIKAVSDYLAVGDKVQVKLLAIDPANGKLSLSRKALLPDDGQVHPDEPREPRPPRSDHFHGHGGGRPGGGGRPPRR